jgi:epoxyqueuosine reductase
MDNRSKLIPPGGDKRVLLHSCCAPCSGEVMEAMLASGIEYTIFFYNPNIHPEKEYLLRKDENVRFAEKHGVPFVDADYDPSGVRVARCASTCASSARRSMRTNTAFR